MTVFIPASIRDPALRQTLQQLARNVGGGGNASISVQEDDPTSATPGTTGQIIYSTGNDSIWVFDGTQWDRASSGTSGITVQVFTYVVPSGAALDYTQSGVASLGIAPDSFKNNAAGTRLLLPRIYLGSEEWSDAQYTAATYRWMKGGVATFTANSSIQKTNSGATSRGVIINQDDIADAGQDVFLCEVTFT